MTVNDPLDGRKANRVPANSMAVCSLWEGAKSLLAYPVRTLHFVGSHKGVRIVEPTALIDEGARGR
jgi:hypothetical protein